MNPNPVFSIITVCYNAEAVVERTLRSVAAQSYRRIEYIVVDGASTDGTLEAVKRCPAVSRWVSEKDGGLYDAMNKGLRMATGDYVCFLNAGDCFHSADTLQIIVQQINNAQCDALPDVVYGQTALVDDAGHFLRMRHLSAPERLTWKSFRSGMLVCHQSFIARRALVPDYDLRYRYSADYDWCVRVLRKSCSTWNTRLTLVDYLAEGLTTRHHRASLVERFRIMCAHYGWLSTVVHHLWFAVRSLRRSWMD